VRRGDTTTIEVFKPRCGVLIGDCRLQRATTVAKAKENLNVELALLNEVETRHTTVHDAVLDVFGHVVGADEEKVNVSVSAVRLKYPLARFLWGHACCVEERPRRFPQTTLRGQSQCESTRHSYAPFKMVS